MRSALLFVASSTAFLCYAKLKALRAVGDRDIHKKDKRADSKGGGLSRKEVSLKNSSVKRYDLHLLIVYRSGYQWGKDIAEESNSFAFSLSQAVGAAAALGNVKITGCVMEGGADDDEFRDIVIYPDALLISGVAKSQIDMFVQELFSRKLSSLTIKRCPWDKIVLICTHAARDKRCGSKGKVYFDKVKASYESRHKGGSVKVLESSHLGGHEFAPTLVTYPSSDYFGNLDLADIESLMSCVDACESCGFNDITFHRGNAGCTSNWLDSTP